MKQRIVTLLVAVVSLLSLSGCASHRLTEGEVYEKEHKEAVTVVRVVPIVISNGKTTTTTMIPYVYNYPERFIVRIREPQGDGTYVTDQYYTDEATYDAVNIGDTFCYDEDRDMSEEPYTRRKSES